MKLKIISLLTTSLLVLTLQAQEKVTVTINYGEEKLSQAFQVNWQEGMTAMLAVQSCANVTTHPVKDYIFVSTINGISTVAGKKAWYYTVNNESTHKLAFRYPVNPGDTVEWIYKKDVCPAIKQKQPCEK